MMRALPFFAATVIGIASSAFGGVPAPTLNEISAMGIGSFLDEDGEQEDWIEIFNPTDDPVSLNDWSLTDNPTNPRKWIFPDVSIGPSEYLIVFASRKDRRPTSGNLHANFGLDTEGEFLGIFDESGTLVDSWEPEFPPQRDGYSYGLHPQSGERVYFSTPTPGKSNESEGSFAEFLDAEVQFSVPRGLYEGQDPIQLELSVADAQAEIRYTTDYTTPTKKNGAIYASPIEVSENTTIRAAAFKEGFGPSWVETHTYFLSLTDDQKSLPIMVVVTDPENLDGPEGLRTGNNPLERGRLWERPVSMEYFNLQSPDGDQVDAGMRVHGGVLRTRAKKAYRLYFREDYGDSELTFLPIPGTPVQSFKRIVLRAGAQDTNPFVHDELSRRTYGNMGQVTSHGTFVQLFINDEYWVTYNPVERYDEYFFDSYLEGGLDWDIIRQSGLSGGDLVEWNKLLDLVSTQDLSNPDRYREATRLLDVVNFADYLLLNNYAGMEDWPNNNWTAARLREPGSRFRFYVWDAEQSYSLKNPNYHNVLESDLDQLNDPIALIYRGLKVNPDFRAVMAARFRKHFYEGGALTDDVVMKFFLDLRYEVRNAVKNMLTRIPAFWIPGRRENVEKHLYDNGFLELVDISNGGAPTPQELPETEIELPEPDANLVPDSLIDPKDLLEFVRQEKDHSPPAHFARRSWSDENWVRYDYSVSLGDLSLVSADFDLDGSIDLGCVNQGYGLISIFLNNGAGVFSQPVQTRGPIGSEVLAAANLDEDQTPDLVIASRLMFRQSLTVFHGNGDGAFTEISSIPINRTEETEVNFPA
ncbi:MAG: CotH kinase family protein, partial [Candidatus Omnitrophica bacterium]|nr:CotH kinase family protein [Candidatus Omnitrophota bacterium]